MVDIIVQMENMRYCIAALEQEGFYFEEAELEVLENIARGANTIEQERNNMMTEIERLKQALPDLFVANRQTGADPYVYLEVNQLLNNYGIKNRSLFNTIERNLACFRLFELREQPVSGKFDFLHLKKIHQAIFQDIYPWAGEERTVTIAKGDTLFCPVHNIQLYQQDIFNKLKKENYLKALDRTEFAERAAFYLGEINALHPFREGNGRSQVEFMRQLALQAGYKLELTVVPQCEMIRAAVQSNNGDNKGFESLISNNLSGGRFS